MFNTMIIGKTSPGKTTTLQALQLVMRRVPGRILIVDVAEFPFSPPRQAKDAKK